MGIEKVGVGLFGSDLNPVNKISTRHTTFDEYDRSIKLILLFEKNAVQGCKIFKTVNYILGRARKPTILWHLKRLYKLGLIDKCGLKSREAFYYFNPDILTPGYKEHLQQETARFFGCKNWHGGIIKPGQNEFKTYSRVRTKYRKLSKTRYILLLKSQAAQVGRDKVLDRELNNSLALWLGVDEAGKQTVKGIQGVKTIPVINRSNKGVVCSDPDRTVPDSLDNC